MPLVQLDELVEHDDTLSSPRYAGIDWDSWKEGRSAVPIGLIRIRVPDAAVPQKIMR